MNIMNSNICIGPSYIPWSLSYKIDFENLHDEHLRNFSRDPARRYESEMELDKSLCQHKHTRNVETLGK